MLRMILSLSLALILSLLAGGVVVQVIGQWRRLRRHRMRVAMQGADKP